MKSYKIEVDTMPKRKSETELKNKSKLVKSNIRCYKCGCNNHKIINCINKGKDPSVLVKTVKVINNLSVINRNKRMLERSVTSQHNYFPKFNFKKK